ncbi:MAG: ArnT family glycosyltransferase [Anaerolineae bacterium]
MTTDAPFVMADRFRTAKPHMPAFAGVILAVVGGAWLRWRFIATVQPYPDEFVTLLAVRAILQKGVPVLPSGLFYEHGLLFSYAGALAAWLFGYSRTVVRLVSLVFGLGTIGLAFYVGRRWFSPLAGLTAALALAVAPAAVLWGGRARMYALLQFLVLLLIFLAVEGALKEKPRRRWSALGLYLAALLTQFVSLLLAPALVVALLAAAWMQGGRPWFRRKSAIGEGLALGFVILAGILVKRAGQPKGIEPLAAGNALEGVAQTIAIYSDFRLDLSAAWGSIAAFFTGPEAVLPTGLALLALGWLLVRLRRIHRSAEAPPPFDLLATLALALLLLLTTAEALLIAPPDRRDEKYLFMLMPVLFLLAGQGLQLLLTLIETKTSAKSRSPIPNPQSLIPNLQSLAALLALIVLLAPAYPATADLLADTGEDYDAAFGYVREQWREGDAVLTGTPAAAAFYLDRNDYYAVQAGGRYDYRILPGAAGPVERWLGSPWIDSLDELQRALAGGRVWLVLERWGLLVEYYEPFFRQNLLAQTEFIREDNGVIVLRSRPDPRPVAEAPARPASAGFGDRQSGQVALLGFTLEPERLTPGQAARLTLYWQARSPLPVDYTVFVHLRTDCRASAQASPTQAETCRPETVAQADHRPLGSIYPTTLWAVGETIRETSYLTPPPDLAPGVYQLWAGLYQLETLERLPVQNDRSGENAVLLGEVVVQ